MSDESERAAYMRRAVALAEEGMRDGHGGPFGAVIVRDGRVIGEGYNRVTSTNDPTAHAEITAIRAACAALGNFSLEGSELYASCEPCPMCLSAIYWARIARVFYAGTRADAARIGFDDDLIYRELAQQAGERAIPLVRVEVEGARSVFDAWEAKNDRIMY
ncbi:MAG: nucleoside deaminase [Alphaproteobacteria bacterium]